MGASPVLELGCCWGLVPTGVSQHLLGCSPWLGLAGLAGFRAERQLRAGADGGALPCTGTHQVPLRPGQPASEGHLLSTGPVSGAEAAMGEEDARGGAG